MTPSSASGVTRNSVNPWRSASISGPAPITANRPQITTRATAAVICSSAK